MDEKYKAWLEEKKEELDEWSRKAIQRDNLKKIAKLLDKFDNNTVKLIDWLRGGKKNFNKKKME